MAYNRGWLAGTGLRCALGLLAVMAAPVAQAQACETGGFDQMLRDGFETVSPPLPPTPTVVVKGSALPGLTPLPTTTLSIPVTPPLIPPPALTPTIRATSDGSWHLASTWGGRVPANCDIVEIPRGRSVSLSGFTANLNGLWIDGELRFGDTDVGLRSRFVVVSGRLLAGTEAAPYSRRAEIVLFGTDGTQNVLGMGTKSIAVVNGGLLKLHGEPRLSWTKLATTAAIGSSSLTLADAPVNWRAGDQLLVLSSGYDPRESEVRTIAAVSGNQVALAAPLQHRHLSLQQTYAGKTLDQRAVVALLSRNIVIRGAEDSAANAFGGHVMSMAGAHVQLSGIEFVQMGQRGRFGRYPMHWHIAGDRSGNYVIGASVRDSFQRAIVAHSTHNVIVDASIAYNVSNHAFVWAEDGDEFGNRFTRNVGALIRSPAPEHFAFPINNPFHGNTSQDEHRSAVFWGRSFDRHVITGNVSGGALDGFGYFFDLFSSAPFGGDEGGGLVFDNNIAHSTYKTFPTGNQINYPEATTGHGLMVSTGSSGSRAHVFNGYTGYHNVSGAWVEDRSMTLRGAMLADNGVGVLLLRARIEDSVVVGDSANPTPLQPFSPSVATGLNAGVQIAGSNHGGKRSALISNVDIINMLPTGVGILWDLDNFSPASRFDRVRFTGTSNRIATLDPINFEFARPPSQALTDSDGSVIGNGVPNRLFRYDAGLIDARCSAFGQSGFYVCPKNASLLLDSEIAVDLASSDGAVFHLRSFNYSDAGMPQEDNVSFIANGGRYDVGTVVRTRYAFRASDMQGKSFELAFKTSGPATRVARDNANVMAFASLSDLRAASVSGHFFDTADGRLYVRLLGSAEQHALVVEAPFVAAVARGKAPQGLPGGALTGYRYSVHQQGYSGSQMRYPLPTNAALRQGEVTTTTLAAGSSTPLLQTFQNGEAGALRFFVFAPVTGLYRVGLWADGGGTSAWLGEHYLNGERWSFLNSNWIQNGQLTTQVVHFQVNGVVQLAAGWHPIDVVFAKIPQHNGGRVLHFRWATPTAPDTWVYPELRRAP